MVEQETENLCVGSSILSLGTIYIFVKSAVACKGPADLDFSAPGTISHVSCFPLVFSFPCRALALPYRHFEIYEPGLETVIYGGVSLLESLYGSHAESLLPAALNK